MTISSKCKPRRISGGVFLCLICIPVILFFRCNGSGSVAAIYVPPVTFSGDLNETAVYLPGNIIHPNTCFLDNSILKMDFYSEDYAVSTTSTGRHLKLWIYPPRPSDSNQIKILTNRIMAHATGYEALGTCTWEITRADSNSTSIGASLTIERYTTESATPLLFYDVTLRASVLGASSCPLGALRITKGKIEGHIQ